MPTIALMVARHLQLSCFSVLGSCHLFSVQPEISACTAFEFWVLHNMSCTQRKRKEKNITIRLSKQKLLKINSRIRLSPKKKLWKINPIDNKFTTLRWRLSLWDKVLCRKVAAKRVEDGADNQSVCSQVLVRQNSQLVDAASGDSTDENYWLRFLLHLFF
jgi:hypothetical protein